MNNLKAEMCQMKQNHADQKLTEYNKRNKTRQETD